MELQTLREARVLHGPLADVAVFRERSRRRRLERLMVVGALASLWMWYRILAGETVLVRPHLPAGVADMAPLLLLVLDPDLDDPARRDTAAAMTSGYTPVMIEHLLDEALVWALRRGADRLSWADLQRAKMTEEIGLAQPVEYTEAERRTIATHESGHATVAWLVGKSRKLEVLSIVKRKLALGLLAHSDREERFLQSESEVHGLVQIALGGLVAEELFFGEISSGPSGDLQAATTLAAQMIGSLGMAGSLFSYEAMLMPNTDIVTRVASSDDGKAAIERILDSARHEVRAMLEEHHVVVESLRDALLERHELIGDEILEVIHHAIHAPAPSAVRSAGAHRAATGDRFGWVGIGGRPPAPRRAAPAAFDLVVHAATLNSVTARL